MNNAVLPVETQVCIVGAGPAGVICSTILSRNGINVVLLEGENDFNRAFRGDTLHASSLEIMEQLGHADEILKLCNSKIESLKMDTQEASLTIANFSGLDSAFPFVGIIPQERFLNFLVEKVSSLPNFTLAMNARVIKLLENNGKVAGVIYKHNDNEIHLKADLVIAADGRGSTLRRLADIKLEKTAPPMDVLWFTLPLPDKLTGKDIVDVKIGSGTMLVMVSRGDHLQLGFIVMKGSYKDLRAQGIEHFQTEVSNLVPELEKVVKEISDWKQLAILSVVTGRVSQWYKDGLLLIGDAAHVMSPVGGVGINYAIQDAVAAANILTTPLKEQAVTIDSLRAVQHRREKAIKFIQFIQGMIQHRIVSHALKSDAPFKPPLPLKIVSKTPFLQKRFARMLAYGLQPEKIHESLSRVN